MHHDLLRPASSAVLTTVRTTRGSLSRVLDVVERLVDLFERAARGAPGCDQRVQLEHVLDVPVGPDDRALDVDAPEHGLEDRQLT